MLYFLSDDLITLTNSVNPDEMLHLFASSNLYPATDFKFDYSLQTPDLSRVVVCFVCLFDLIL